MVKLTFEFSAGGADPVGVNNFTDVRTVNINQKLGICRVTSIKPVWEFCLTPYRFPRYHIDCYTSLLITTPLTSDMVCVNLHHSTLMNTDQQSNTICVFSVSIATKIWPRSVSFSVSDAASTSMSKFLAQGSALVEHEECWSQLNLLSNKIWIALEKKKLATLD